MPTAPGQAAPAGRGAASWQVSPAAEGTPEQLEGQRGQRQRQRGDERWSEFLTERVDSNIGEQLAELGLVRQAIGDGILINDGSEAAQVVLEEPELREQHENGARLVGELHRQRRPQVRPDVPPKKPEAARADGPGAERE